MQASLILVFVAFAAAAPKATQLNFRNLYKPAINTVIVKPGPRIIGGQEAKPHAFPYQVFLEFSGGNSGWYCGGSLISSNYVLSAGHCGDGAATVKVVLGAHRPLQNEDTQVVLNSRDITVHERYDAFNIVNDISVIKLPRSAPSTSAIGTISLPRLGDSNTYEGSSATVSGWGLTRGGGSLSTVLNYVQVPVISNKQCEQIFGSLESSILCTSGDQKTGTCNGDSGGPLVVNGVQIGIVSFGIRDCPVGYPSAFTRVTSFLTWLQSHTDAL